MNEERKDTSKQVLLSVLGVAILIVAVVGISFAAFTYTRSGERENIVTTGTLVMDYTESTNGINIADAIPMTEAQALAAYTGNKAYDKDGSAEDNKGANYGTDAGTGDYAKSSQSDNVFDFTVSAKISGSTTIDYDIVAVKDNATVADCDATAYANGKKVADATASAEEAADYAKCTLVSDEDIRLWIGEATGSKSDDYIDDIATKPTIADSDYVAIDLDSENATYGSAWKSGTAHTSELGSPSDSMLLKKDKFTATGTRYYRLKMWVDQAYVVDGTARTYKVKVNVYSKDRNTSKMAD